MFVVVILKIGVKEVEEEEEEVGGGVVEYGGVEEVEEVEEPEEEKVGSCTEEDVVVVVVEWEERGSGLSSEESRPKLLRSEREEGRECMRSEEGIIPESA